MYGTGDVDSFKDSVCSHSHLYGLVRSSLSICRLRIRHGVEADDQII